ncbi:SdiA-regulated domain-containing protein [Aquimarina rubra]|uniref:SdiA-regulated domain-containing protein n=1 Tax=Aquimarina rubra TaxID=1920033 RepID=A0ABW5LLU0_9FLAO
MKNTDLVFINDLSKLNREISGMTIFPNEKIIYAVNDSGNDNTIFQLDLKGKIKKEIRIPNTTNKDWEDLAYDHENNLYVGDFGNNNNDRKDLMIYKISSISSNPMASEISFELEDQKKFPPKKKERNFDIEAMIYWNDNLYLFSKNRSAKFKGVTKLYKIPARPGKHIAKLISSFETCNDSKDCFVSGAAINSDGTKIVLLTYNKLFVLSDYKGDSFFEGTINKIKLNHYSQKEGICFKNDNTLLITDEGSGKAAGNLYEYSLD